MTHTVDIRRCGCACRRWQFIVAWLATFSWAVYAKTGANAAEQYDPFEARPRFHDPFEARPRPSTTHRHNISQRIVRDPFDDIPQAAPTRAQLEKGHEPRKQDTEIRQVNLQIPTADAPGSAKSLGFTSPENASGLVEQPAEMNQPVVRSDSCAAAAERPLAELGISIEPPTGLLPTNRAADCWESINSNAGPIAGARSWAWFNYQWDATSFCHRPLYFEEINLERYGYGCGWCLQPGASAAHFFGTVPALPYLMTVDCPHECIYTLGHYRPGSCPPWRHHLPPCDPLAAAPQGGVLTGLIFLIP
jgi:hypothetical protein